LPQQPSPAAGPQILPAAPQTSALGPAAGLSHPAPAPDDAASPDSDENKAAKTAPETAQDTGEEQQADRPKTAKVDWPKSSIPKEAAVDTYPPKPKPSIEF